jgi:Arc/MetJ-type ribon-helix-helix transcriptional regulator
MGAARTTARPDVRYVASMVKTTVRIPDELHRELKLAATERGISTSELIRAAIRREVQRSPRGQVDRDERRRRMLATIGTLDRTTYPPGYLHGVRTGSRG